MASQRLKRSKPRTLPLYPRKSKKLNLLQRSRSTTSLMSNAGWSGSSGVYQSFSSLALSAGQCIFAMPIRLSKAMLSATASYVWSKATIIPQSRILTTSSPPKAPPIPFANYSTKSATTNSQSNAKPNSPSSNSDSQRSKPRSLVRSSNHKQVTLNGRIPLTAFAVSGILVKKKTTSQSHIFSTNK